MKHDIPASLRPVWMHQRDINNHYTGFTSCFLVHREAKPLAQDLILGHVPIFGIGHAKCGKKDKPNKKIGRDISLGRALKAHQQLTS